MKIITTQMFCEQPTRDSIRCHDRIVSRLRNNQGLHLENVLGSTFQVRGLGSTQKQTFKQVPGIPICSLCDPLILMSLVQMRPFNPGNSMCCMKPT